MSTLVNPINSLPSTDATTKEQCDTVATLALMQFERMREDRSELELPFYKCSRMLSVLNWIATSFVTDPIGDAVATALSAEEDQITFYIATHRGKPRPEDKENGANFVQLLRDNIGQIDVTLITDRFMITLAPRLYPRFARKVDMIRILDRDNKTSEPRFNRIVDRWAANGNMEDGALFLKESLELGAVKDENGNQRLKRVFNAIVSRATADVKNGLPQDEETRRSRVISFSFAALTLVESKFFKYFDSDEQDLQNPIPPLDDDFIWILRLRRRLWRLSRYLTDQGFGGSEIKIVWIGDQLGVLPRPHPDTVVITQSPERFLEELFMKYGYGEGNKPLPVIPPEIKNNLENLWHADVATNIYLSELQMIGYLEANDIQTQGNCIGNSKLMCWACNAYMAKVNTIRESNGQDQWVLSGTSDKPHHRWLIPQNSIGEGVARDLKKILVSLVKRLAAELTWQNISGPDTGLGLVMT